jgi:hypothetical protein
MPSMQLCMAPHSLRTLQSGMRSLFAKHRYSPLCSWQITSWKSLRMHSAFVRSTAQVVRHTPSRHTLPLAQSPSRAQNGRGCQLGRQNRSSAQNSPLALQVPVREQSGKQRPCTQCSPLPHWAVPVHSPGSGRQKPRSHLWPEAQSDGPVQTLTHVLSTHARPAPHW